MSDHHERPKVLTVAELAARLGVCRQTVYALERRGELRVIRIGRALRVPTSELERLMGTGEHPTQHPTATR